MNYILLGNIIGFIGAVLMVCVGLVKKRRNILLLQSSQFLVMSASNFVLGAYAGGISNILGVVRNLFCIKRTLPIWAGLIFVALQAVLTFAFGASASLWLNILPVFSALLFTVFINTKNEVLLKSVFIIGQLCWAVYDLMTKNYTASAFDMFAAVSNMVGIYTVCKARRQGNA